MADETLIEPTEAEQDEIDRLSAAAKKENDFWDAIDARVKTISDKLGKRIVPIVIRDLKFAENGEYVIGFMYRPDMVTQLRLSDRGQETASGFSQEEASKVLQGSLITSESDPRINMTTDEGELYWKGALLCLFDFIKGAIPVIKKK